MALSGRKAVASYLALIIFPSCRFPVYRKYESCLQAMVGLMECGAHRSHGYELCDNDRQGLRECIRKTKPLNVAKERVANVREIVPGNGHDKMPDIFQSSPWGSIGIVSCRWNLCSNFKNIDFMAIGSSVPTPKAFARCKTTIVRASITRAASCCPYRLAVHPSAPD